MDREELRRKANELPLLPGVYLMMDSAGTVIYVGKAKKLKNRVSQYFRSESAHNEKTKRMVRQVDHFDTITVSSEFEALLLENSLIKRHQPRYNILLKDDKGYPFVCLDPKAPYPRFTLSNTPTEKQRVFGPFGGRHDTRLALDAIAKVLQLPQCRRVFPRDIGRERPCLCFSMGQCAGWCRGEPPQEEYRRRIEQAELLLDGKLKELIRPLSEEMEREAEALHFERCAVLRDEIQAMETLGKRQKVIAGVCADSHVWGLYRGDVKWAYAVLFIQNGAVSGKETLVFDMPVEETPEEVLGSLLRAYYLPRKALPHEILLPMLPEDAESLAAAMSETAGRRVYIRVPQRGEKAELSEMALRNAAEEAERATGEEERRSRSLALLGEYLSLPAAPHRIESYDISNMGKDDLVASMVVTEDGKFRKRDYRKFKIKSVTDAPDDYASMEEVLSRRFERLQNGDEKFAAMPDVLFIDGGETHAAIAERVLSRYGLSIPVFGMVKDGRHRTRALVTSEGREIGIRGNAAVFALVGRIQEETHRFAVTYQRKKRSQRMLNRE